MEIDGVDLRLGASIVAAKISEDDTEGFNGGLGRGVVPNAIGGLTPAAELSERPLPDGFVCIGIGGEEWSLGFHVLLGDWPIPRGPAGVERGADPLAGRVVLELGVMEEDVDGEDELVVAAVGIGCHCGIDGREEVILMGPTLLDPG
jgi:hypothetical protein